MKKVLKTIFRFMFFYNVLFLVVSCMMPMTEDLNGDLSKMEEGARRSLLLNGQGIFFGNLHSHTRYSDGKGTPAEALTWARDFGFDFYAITDHAELLTKWQWKDTEKQVNLFNKPGEFVAIRGFEWSHPIRGHINVFNTSSSHGFFRYWSLRSFYKWIRSQNAIGMWNHPGRTAWPGDFNRLKIYDSRNIPHMALMETGNGGNGNNSGLYEPYYILALDKGWKPGAANNLDNHSLGGNSHRTAVVAQELTRESILEAIRERKTYGTDDPNLKLIFSCDRGFMGEEIQYQGAVRFQIEVWDDEPLEKIELVSNGGQVVATWESSGENSTYWNPEVQVTGKKFFYLRVSSVNYLEPDDGPRQTAISSPIWFH